MFFINIGLGSIVSSDRIILIVKPESAPIRRVIQEAKEKSLFIDATFGRKKRSALVMDTGHVILSSVQPETMMQRVNNKID